MDPDDLQSEKKSVLLGSSNFLGIIYKHQIRDLMSLKGGYFPNNNRWEFHRKQVVHKPNQHLTQPTAQNDWLTSFAHFCFDKSSSSGSPPQRVSGGRQLNRGARVGLVVRWIGQQQQDEHFVDLVHTTSLSDCLKMWHECWKKVSKGWRADIRLCNKNSEFAWV